MKPLVDSVLKAACIAGLLLSSQVTANTYQLFLVRHAEKAVVDSADPALSECGQLQAKALATLFKAVPLPQLFHTPYQRTTMTATALLQQGRRLRSYDPAKLTELSQQLLQAQQSAVVVGHSNTTPQLAAMLSGQEIPAMSEQQYGVIYQLIFNKQQLIWMNQLQLPHPKDCTQHK